MTQSTSPAAHQHHAYATREEWLVAGIEALRPIFAVKAGVVVPTVRVSVGWTSASRRERHAVIGALWSPSVVADGVPAMFVSPIIDDPVRVLDIVAHELCHAVDGNRSGHRGEFARIAKAIGLAGHMTATVAGPELKAELEAIVESLGTYPHARIDLDGDVPRPVPTPGDPVPAPIPPISHPKQTTRMIRVYCDRYECPSEGYTARTTRKWLDRYGAPYCPACGHRMMTG